MDHTEIISRIIKLRKKLGLKQKEFAPIIGVQPNTLSRWENKKNVPIPMALKKMEEILAFRPERQREKIASERIEEVLQIMHRLREEKNSGASEKNK